MADISKCADKDCPSAPRCYRFTATPSEFLQAYGQFGREKDASKCSHFWPVKDKESNEGVGALASRTQTSLA